MLPLPSFLLLTVIEFYLLHTLNELNDFTLFSSRLIETLDVEFAAKAHKRQYPNDMKSITAEEYQKNQRTIVTKDTGKYKEIDNGKKNIYRIAHQERLNAGVVTDTLHNVACHLCIKVMKWQFHEFHQKVRDKSNIYARVDMQHNPTSQKANGKLREKESKLGNENERDKAEIAIADADINHSLSKKRKDHLQETPQRHTEKDLRKLSFVR